MNETDNTTRPARLHRLAPWILAAAALGLYFTTMSRGAFPGLPAKSLAWHLGLDSYPTLLDPLWGFLVRFCDRLPGESVAFWTGLLSAVFGALCVALLTTLMMRVRYSCHDPHDSEETGREAQARLLAGTMAGLFLMVNIPFWILSTRSLPGTFHLLMLLGAAWLFSEYQRAGAPMRLYLLGLLYGAGIAEFATFWVFAPLAALLVMRAMLQRAEFSVRVLLRTGLCAVPGLLLYFLSAWQLWQDPAILLRGFGSKWAVIWFIWRDQWNLIVHAPQTTGFLMVLVLTVVPWGVMFLMRPKKPAWRYSAWQVFLRLVVLTAALGALFNAPLSPWNFFGMNYLIATPYLILAICAGSVAGEFWVMGQGRGHRNAGIGQPLRRLMGLLGILLPLAAVAAGILNLPTADGRPGTGIDAMARQVLDDLRGRNVLLSAGVMDDNLQLAAHHRGQALTVISLPQTSSDLYRKYLAIFFPEPRHQSLLQVGSGAFLQDLLSTDEGLQRVAALDEIDPLREFGYLAPDHLLYCVEPSADHIDLSQLIEGQKPFWARMEAQAGHPLDERNLAYGYQRYLLRIAAKVANNIGFLQVERGDLDGAMATFRQARRIDPGNISALLNLITLAHQKNLPELAAYEAEWEEFKSRHVDSRVMWSLSSLYGYVHNTSLLVRQGMMWAVSGKPRMAEAELRRATGKQPVNAAIKAFLGRAYLHGGDLERSAQLYREAVAENPRDVKSLLMLAEMSMNAEDYEEAARLLDQVEAVGVSASTLRFERAALACLQGQTENALASLKELLKQDKENVRAWALLAMLTGDGRDPGTYEKALVSLKNLQGSSPDVRLMLAELYMGRQEWPAARTELEQVVRMNPRQIRAWELLVSIDFQERKRELAEDHVRILLTLAPENYTGNVMLGSFQYARGQFSLAESSYRTALKARRDPEGLNDLAYLLMIKGGAMEEARRLSEEALALQPANPVFLSTRGEINLREKRFDEAERDLQHVLEIVPDNAQVLLLSAQLYATRDQKQAALEVAESLEPRQGELPAEQQVELQNLLKQLR